MLTPAELAAHLRISERTVARMVIDGCPSMLVGSRRRFEIAPVTAWITERAACPPEKTKMADGTQKRASVANAFTDVSRRAHLRVMPGASKRS